MQPNKANKFNEELGSILENPQKVQSKLESVMGLFGQKKHLSVFNVLKEKGHEVSTLLNFLFLLPFYGIDNIYNMVKSGFCKMNKDSFYAVKTDSRIDWRKLLLLYVKRFLFLTNSRETMKPSGITALIGDDSTFGKTGIKMENISRVHDHVTNTFILGFKILVVGYWDGGSFIPVDFSIHREKGNKLKKAKDATKAALNAVRRTKQKLKKAEASFVTKQKSTEKHRARAMGNSTKTNLSKLENAILSAQKVQERIESIKKELSKREKQLSQLKKEQLTVAKKHPEYGLRRKEKKQQFSKKRDKSSFGYARSKEADISKTAMFIKMVVRAIKNGFVPDYILTDTWFFCQELLKTADRFASKGVKLLSMAKIGNTKYTLMNGKTCNAHSLIKTYQGKACYNRALKAHYMKIPVTYSGIRVNLFFVKLGSRASWRLLVTNDLSIKFTDVIKVYQLRWSIEVFFKECKQYLHLGKSSSSDFDGQIADATIAMMQHIMLTFYKRMNCQQSFRELFKEISNEAIESSLAEKLWETFLQVLLAFDEILKIDILEAYQETLRNEKAMSFMKQFIFQKSSLKNAA